MGNERLIELPDYGRLLVITDLHGNFKDYKRYLRLWDSDDPDFHIVFTGDLIHAMDDEDGSVEIVEDAMFKSEEYSNYHCLLGNHEWCHITNENIYKAEVDLKADFENLVSYKKGYIEPSLTNYIRFFKSMPYFLKTANGLFISHAGPSEKVLSINDFNNVCEDNQFSAGLYGFLWNRYGGYRGYTTGDVSHFLEMVESKYMVVGHTVVDSGYKIIGNQMVLSSSFFTSVKSYLDIDLSKDLNSMDDLINNVKILE
jgi:serine/threonine-protein phosphatase PP1 catalytic subunit